MQKTHQGSLAVVQMRNDAVCALVVRVDGGAKAPHSSIGEGNGTPLQCSCLENPMNGGAWSAPIHGVTKSWT